jgi:hypothetical protein
MVSALGLQRVQLFDCTKPGEDPHDPKQVEQMESLIDRYLQKVKGKPGEAEWLARREDLRQRLHTVGIQGATALLERGEK